ncbi:unnamed protein product [Adineta steineri]|uniref:Uncharacterized protein n=1 Tax=Adineta steineri TaxID=433720 RepID=A0A818SJC1_9BILA|nr:unnamed protein product [Adineta steineri]CAF3670373.1 unnamed protein product [Adineta steineri]
MAALDKMMIDDRDLAARYFGENSLDDLTADQFLFSKPPNQQDFNSKSKMKQDPSNKDDDLSGLFGRRVYLESPSFDNKEEEDMYRYVPSRLSDVPPSLVEKATKPITTETLIDSLDFELDLLGAANTRHGVPFRTDTQFLKDSKPPAPLTQLTNPLKPSPLTNVQRADPRQDPLLGPLLAELDAMTTQQPYIPQQFSTIPNYRRNSVPYEPNHTRPPPVPSHANHMLTTKANRTVNDALLEAELFDSLNIRDPPIPPPQDRQHITFSAPSIISSNHPQHQQQQRLPTRPLDMNNIDMFMPSTYETGTGVFANQYGTNDQVFQQPLLNALGQNYVPNARPSASQHHQQQQQQQQQPPPQQQQQQPFEQRDKSYDDIYARMSPPQRTTYVPPQQSAHNNNNNNQYQQPQQYQFQQPDTMFDNLQSQMLPQQAQNNNTNHYQQQQQQQPSTLPNRQTTYNNNEQNNDPFSEFQDIYNSSQYRRPSQAPSQSSHPSSYQQPRMMPPPPQSQQQRMMHPPPPSQQQTGMPPQPPSFQPPRMMPPSQQQSMGPPQPPPFQQPRMMPPQPPTSQQPRMMPPQPPSFQQPRMMPPTPSAQQPRMPQPQFPQQQQQQQHEEYHMSPSSAQQQQNQQQYYEEDGLNSNYPPNDNNMFFTDINDDPFDQVNYPQHQQQQSSMNNQNNGDQQEDQDSKRQAIWDELQRTNAKVQEKNAKKRESANRREQILKGNYGSSTAWNMNGSKLSSAQSKPGEHSPPTRRPPPQPPAPVSKVNYIEDNIDMIKNKENYYHRYPAKKYENLYSKRKDLFGGGGNTNNNNNNQKNNQNQNTNNNFEQVQQMNHAAVTYANGEHHANLPITINLNPGNNSKNENFPATVSIPLDSHVTRVGDKINVNIDVRLHDLQSMKQQQNNDRPDYSGLDPLERHIRKLENSIDHSLPPTHSPPRRYSPPPPPLSNPSVNPSIGRYGKMTTGTGHGGYSPPSYKNDNHSYKNDHHSYSAKIQQEDSYLAKMNQPQKRPTQYKPYSGQDYEQFKKNHRFGTGCLGFDYDNPEYKEKSDKISKTKEYAQQVVIRNKQKLAEAPRRTLSETRKPVEPAEPSRTQRALEYARAATRQKIPISSATQSSPSYHDEPAPLQRRPTEIPRQPPPSIKKQPTKIMQNDDNELVERLAMRHERDKAQVQGILNPSQKRREQLFDDDDRHMSDIEKLAQNRANQRRLSPPKPLPPPGPGNNGNARRPLRFDNQVSSDELIVPPQQQYRPVQQQQQQPAQQQPIQQRSPIPQIVQPHQPVPQFTQQRSPPIQQQEQPQPQIHVQQHPNIIPQQNTNVDKLANRHNDEKMLMEAIRQELKERPLDDDEELVVVEQ